MSRETDILAALTDVPTPAKVIWRKIDCWSDTSVKQVLDDLVRAGRVVRTQDTDLPRRVHARNLYARATTFRHQQGGAHDSLVLTGTREKLGKPAAAVNVLPR